MGMSRSDYMNAKAYADEAERRVLEHFQNEGGEVTMHEGKEDQKWGDMTVTWGGVKFTVEVKTTPHMDPKTSKGAVCVEHIQNPKTAEFVGGPEGWLHTCKADYILYYTPNAKQDILVNLAELRKFMLDGEHNYEYRKGTKFGTGSEYWLVDVEEFLRAVPSASAVQVHKREEDADVWHEWLMAGKKRFGR